MQILRVCVFALAVGFLFSCSSALEVTPAIPRKFEIATSESLQLIVLELTDAYHRAHPFVTFNISTGNSAVALAEFGHGNVDAVIAVRTLAQTDLTRMNADARLIGRDGIAIVTNPSNSLQNLSRDKAMKIFAGDLRDWRELGAKLPIGASPIIAVVSREDGSGTRDIFEARLMSGSKVTPTALVQPSERDVVEYVSAQPDAIGYISFQALSSRVHSLSVDGAEPTLANIAGKRYPLERPVYLVTPSKPSPDLAEFTAYLAGTDAHRILEKYLVTQ